MQIEKNTELFVQLGSKNKKHLRGSTQTTIHPLTTILTVALGQYNSLIMGHGQYNSLGEYCGPDTASSVFLILISYYIGCILVNVDEHM